MTSRHPQPRSAITLYLFRLGRAQQQSFQGGECPWESLEALENEAPPDGIAWLHINASQPCAIEALERLDLDPLTLSTLLTSETRPRCAVHAQRVTLNLRGVNLNPQSEPEDMISLRMFATSRLLITLQGRHLKAISELSELLQRGDVEPVEGVSDLIARIAHTLTARAEPVVTDLTERVDELEERLLGLSQRRGVRGEGGRSALAQLRSTAIILRRYLSPQRDALLTLSLATLSWQSERDQRHLREAIERVSRLAEELDALRDRAIVLQDQLFDLRAEQSNRQMFTLSVVTALFLPLSLITGLLGVNVGGIPGAQDPLAFWVLCALLVLIACVQGLIFKRLGLF